MYLPALTDAELAHHADVTFDALTATDLQTELAKRFAAKTEELEASREVLQLLEEFDIDSPDELKKLLQRDAQLRDVLDSLAQPLADLQALATP